MGRLARIALSCALASSPAAPQSSTKSFFEERLLDRAPVVVRARFDADQSCFDVDVAAFKVIRQLRGDADARILVLGAAQLSSRLRDVDRMLFLRREPSGCLYRVIDSIDLVEEGDAIEALVRGFLALGDETDPGRRRAGLKQLVRDALGMRSEFGRKLGAREIDRLARRDPPVLGVDEIAEFGAAAGNLPPKEAGRVDAALEAAENAHLRRYAGTQKRIARGPRRTRFLKLVGELLRCLDPAAADAPIDQIALQFGTLAGPLLVAALDDERARARALLHLGAMQWRPAVPGLVQRLTAMPADAGAVAACLGEIGDEAAVPAIGRCLSDPEHFEAAVVALARIRTTASTRALDAMLRELRKDPRQEPRVATIERAKSSAFQEQDVARRLEAKGRYPRE
jgi:hypothetical protein